MGGCGWEDVSGRVWMGGCEWEGVGGRVDCEGRMVLYIPNAVSAHSHIHFCVSALQAIGSGRGADSNGECETGLSLLQGGP